MGVTAAGPEDRIYTREEYRAWYDAQPRGRFERVDGHIVAMGAERLGHIRMKTAVWLVLRQALSRAGVRCEAVGDGATVQTGDGDFEPDALINCGEPIDDGEVAAPNPVVIVEVLSPGTAAVDTGNKLLGYFDVPSVSHYLIVNPAKRQVIHHRRVLDGIATRLVFHGPIVLDPPGITITLEEVYEEAAR